MRLYQSIRAQIAFQSESKMQETAADIVARECPQVRRADWQEFCGAV